MEKDVKIEKMVLNIDGEKVSLSMDQAKKSSKRLSRNSITITIGGIDPIIGEHTPFQRIGIMSCIAVMLKILRLEMF